MSDDLQTICDEVEREYGMGGLSDGLYGDFAKDVAKRFAARSWQPIETAPKNGNMVLLSDGRDVDVGFWHDGEGCHRAGPGWFAEMDRGNLLTARNYVATHWMQLPDPPSA